MTMRTNKGDKEEIQAKMPKNSKAQKGEAYVRNM
jgi:hypothetical protein